MRTALFESITKTFSLFEYYCSCVLNLVNSICFCYSKVPCFAFVSNHVNCDCGVMSIVVADKVVLFMY